MQGEMIKIRIVSLAYLPPVYLPSVPFDHILENMTTTIRSLLLTLPIVFLSACSGEPASSSEEASDGASITGSCDPIVDEYEALMKQYEDQLEGMIAVGSSDRSGMAELTGSMRTKIDEIRKKGEKELGAECWGRFQRSIRAHGNRVGALNKQIMEISMKEKGLDTTGTGQR